MLQYNRSGNSLSGSRGLLKPTIRLMRPLCSTLSVQYTRIHMEPDLGIPAQGGEWNRKQHFLINTFPNFSWLPTRVVSARRSVVEGGHSLC